MSLAHTSSLQKNTNQMASRATEPLSRFPFQYTIFFQRKCKTQTRCEMTKGSGVFVLPPHITKWALRPSRSSKANISFGFAEKKKKRNKNLAWILEKGNAILFWGRINLQMLYPRQDRGMKWVEDEKKFLSPILPFLISSESASRTRHTADILRWPRCSLLSHTSCLSQVNFLTDILFGGHWDEISGYKDCGAASTMKLDTVYLSWLIHQLASKSNQYGSPMTFSSSVKVTLIFLLTPSFILSYSS